MNRSAVTTAVAVVAAFGLGLAWSYFTSSQAGGVAVVDLDEVARRLGRDQEMVESIRTQSGALTQRLAAAQKSANDQLGKLRASLQEDQQISNEEAQQYVRVQRSAQVQLNQLQQQANLSLNQHRQQLISQFRKDAQPIVKRVAHEKGFDSVVTRNDTVVFSFEDSVDITEDVIKLMSAEMPARSSSTKADTTPQSTAPAASGSSATPQQTATTSPGSATK